MRIMTGVGDLVQMTEDVHIGRILGGQMIGRLGDTVCDIYRAHGDEERKFFC
jgi:hypothetical protein